MSIPKQITFLNDNVDFLSKTVTTFCEPIMSTLGPGGQTVIITDEDGGLPHVTKDGVTVSESIFFKDQRKQAIASLIKEAARKTANAVGDGTTTSIVLTEAMITKGILQLININSRKEFFDGFDIAFEKVIDYLTESSIPINKNSELLESIIKISTNNDEKVCRFIISAFKQAGEDGLVSVELHNEISTEVVIKGGASIESNTFTPSGKKWEIEGSNIELILVSGPIRDVHEIKNILLSLSRSKNPAIIVAKEFSEAVINTIAVNNYAKRINVVLVESEGFAKGSRMELLEDLQTIFNTEIYSTDGMTELPLSSYTSSACINLSKAVITSTETILFKLDDEFSSAAEARYAKLKSEYNLAKISMEDSSVIDGGTIRHLQRRMAKYNTVAIIKVGAATKAEANEIKDRIEDALSAVVAAVNGGITQGGGMSLYKAAEYLKNIELKASDDFLEGYNLILDCCKEPLNILARNSGVSMDEIPFKTMGIGDVYDFKDFDVVNYIDGGIIDPTLVSIAALTNSSSVAKTILKSNSIISEWQDREVE